MFLLGNAPVRLGGAKSAYGRHRDWLNSAARKIRSDNGSVLRMMLVARTADADGGGAKAGAKRKAKEESQHGSIPRFDRRRVLGRTTSASLQAEGDFPGKDVLFS